MQQCQGMLLTRQWQDRGNGQSLLLWIATANGPLQAEIAEQESVFFIARDRLELVEGLLGKKVPWRAADVDLNCLGEEGKPATACYFRNQKDLGFARALLQQAGETPFESDIRPPDRYLMERFIRGTLEVEGEITQRRGYSYVLNPRIRPSDRVPDLLVVSLDIETSISRNIVISIGVAGHDFSKVFMLGEPQATTMEALEFLPDETQLIRKFLNWFADLDPDLVIGWNVVGFDLKFLQDRCDALGIDFNLGRANSPVNWRFLDGQQRVFAVVPGRVVLDGIELLRTATYSFESFSLENVSRELLGRGKLVEDVDSRAVEIDQMHVRDPVALARYNLEDCVLVLDIFEKTDLISFAIQRACLTGLEMDRQGGSVASFDFLYLPRLHRAGYVAPVVDESSIAHSPGGYVLESQPGLYRDVIVLDFKSLYPSIIRTFHVDPLALHIPDDERIPGFLEASFSKRQSILPALIEELWEARDLAKQENNGPASQAIKIIMNSFYGVLGTPGCRFFDRRLASSITMRGHEILKKTRDLIESKGYPVIYGDTDSVFVHMESEGRRVDAAGQSLAAYLNDWWRQHLLEEYDTQSFLELEFETHFERFFMPTIRGSEQGSKKRYAGMIQEPHGESRMIFKGLESVRSDWSALAREFQQKLYLRLFKEEPLDEFVKLTVRQVQSGELDDQLVLRRRLRRKLDDYVRNVPPHVRAARLADQHRESLGLAPRYNQGGWIEYVMTVNGPEPLAYVRSQLDYEFYVDRQLAPIADAVLSLQNSSLAKLTDRQMGLF